MYCLIIWNIGKVYVLSVDVKKNEKRDNFISRKLFFFLKVDSGEIFHHFQRTDVDLRTKTDQSFYIPTQMISGRTNWDCGD